MFPPLKIAAGLERSRRCHVNGVKMSQGGSEMIFFFNFCKAEVGSPLPPAQDDGVVLCFPVLSRSISRRDSPPFH